MPGEQDLVAVGPGLLGAAVLVVAGLLLLTKLLDVLSTLRAVAAEHETNQLVAPLMRRFGVRAVAWFVFAVACAVITASAWLAWVGPPAFGVAFCGLGLGISVVQACVARANLRGRHDVITRGVLRWHGRLRGWLRQ